MRAVVVADGELKLQHRPDPVPGDTELLVAVRAAGLNGADLMQRRGRYAPPPGVPADIPGLELAGEVVAVGGRVRRFGLGDRVMAVVGGGGQATRAVVDESHALPVPPGLGWAEAGGFPEVFTTAYDALWAQCQLGVGDRLLVTGAAGGVGVAGVQLGAATGAQVVASVHDPGSRAGVVALGADLVVDPAEVADHGPYDVVLELVGAASLPAALGALAVGGRVSVIGVGSGAKSSWTSGPSWAGGPGSPGRRCGRGTGPRRRTWRRRCGHTCCPCSSGDGSGYRWPRRSASTRSIAAYDRFAAGSKLGKIVLMT